MFNSKGATHYEENPFPAAGGPNGTEPLRLRRQQQQQR